MNLESKMRLSPEATGEKQPEAAGSHPDSKTLRLSGADCSSSPSAKQLLKRQTAQGQGDFGSPKPGRYRRSNPLALENPRSTKGNRDMQSAPPTDTRQQTFGATHRAGRDLNQDFGPVLIVGTGLLGASLGLALSAKGIPVYLRDASPTALALSSDLGAGVIWEQRAPAAADPKLVIVCTPPDVTARCVKQALAEFPHAIVSDVASVKTKIHLELNKHRTDLSRYLGSHPMAGRERSGAVFARADLFHGQPFVLVKHDQTSPVVLEKIRRLALELGSFPIEMEAKQHDESVALISHVPQLLASLLASRLVSAPADCLELAGKGLRDTTRIARSDPKLWSQIISANSQPIAQILRQVHTELGELIGALECSAPTCNQVDNALPAGQIGVITQIMHQGNLGMERIPGKHGGSPRRYAEVLIEIPDRPGYLGKLFQDVGQAGISVEDFNLEHSPGAPFGIAQILVEPCQLAPLTKALQAKNWQVIGA